MISCEKAAKTVDEAIEEALRELQCTRDDVEVKVLDEGSKGFLGILGTKLARVLVTRKNPEAVPAPVAAKVEPSPVPEAVPVDAKAPGISLEDAQEGIAKARTFLASVLTGMNVEADMDEQFDNGVLHLNLTGQNLGILIGKHGQTLDSLQYLVGLVANKGNKEGHGRLRVVIDAEGYRRRREQTLRSLAIRLADKVRREGRSAFLEPMSANERRIIHTTLQHNTYVSTHSEGEEPNRKVVISPRSAYGSRYGSGGNGGRTGGRTRTGSGNYNR